MKKIILLFFLSVYIMPAVAQKAMVQKGDEHFKKMAYSQAIPYYLKAVKKDSTCSDAIFRLADSYRLTNNRLEAEKWYEKVVALPAARPLDKFYYGQMLMNNGKNAQAKKYMQDYLLSNSEDTRGRSFVKAIDSYENFFADSSNYAVTRLDINTLNADFGAAIYQDGIVFASSRPNTTMIERKHAWTNENFLTLYYSRGKDNKFREPEVFSKTLESKYNEGPVCFSKNGEEIYITRNLEEGKTIKSTDRSLKIKIFQAKSSGNGQWSTLQPFAFNNANYNTGHPALSADGQKLYFISDMPGGKGGMDLYVCQREGEKWGNPVNLGDVVNTPGNEMFPFVMEDGTLYFASDGQAGIGGLDIFYTQELAGKYNTPVNAGYPINSADDDFGFVYDLKNKSGYLSSNRAQRNIDDDIYSFKKKNVRVRGIIVNKEDGSPIKNARIELKNGNTVIPFTTTENGRFDFPAEFDMEYEVKGQAEKMGDAVAAVSTSSANPVDPFVRLELGKAAAFALNINVIDAETKQPIPGANIMEEVTSRQLGSTDLSGAYKQPIIPQKDEQLLVSSPGYRSKIIMMKGQSGQEPKDVFYTVELNPAKDIAPHENWYKIIYYDLDKATIRLDAENTMKDIANFLKTNPEVKISIHSHTDSRATAEYNMRLSENRSKTVRQYLLDNGVSSKQIGKIVSTGKTMLVNNCGDNEPCSEAMHQLNRRTEFQVMELLK
jgi:outer membrane protein OmpA-like peptidoglycan-associated protein/tetratricopeptide (TPR) repeat protein